MQAAPGWYPDPRGGDGYRYWTGEGWAPDPGSSMPPMPATPHGAAVPANAGGWQRPDPDSSRLPFAAPAGFDQIDTAYGATHSPGDVPPWRRAATYAALAAGLGLGFGAGFVVADSRDDRLAPSAVAGASPTPSTSARRTPAPSAGPSEKTDESDELESTPAPPEDGPRDPDAALLDRLGLRPTDVAPDVRIELIPGGDKVLGQTTLDLCEATYDSEFRRTARRQLVAVDAKDEVVLSTEAVLYRDAAATAAAFDELRSNAAVCSARTGVDTDWQKVEGVERLAYEIRSEDGKVASTIVYLRRGRTLLALYFRHPGVEQTAVAGQKTIPGVVGAYSKRLAAMPAVAGSVT
ncbi:MAG: DUF2510 domain-containing protein [Mycobacteriales bacterium]